MIEPTIPTVAVLRAVDPVAVPEPPASPPAGVSGTGAADFARVFEMEEARRKRAGVDAIPDEVYADISRAADLVDELYASGRSVRFGTHSLSKRIVADLVDADGGVIRRLPLTEVIGRLDPEPAA
jgi:hypothetical protein